MKPLLAAVIVSFLLVSCSGTSVKTETYNDGTIKSQKTYRFVHGKKQLIREVQYHPNGQKYIEGNYSDSLREGHWVAWYKDGRIWSEGDYKHGKNEGKYTVNYPNGNKYYEGEYLNGMRTGIWIYYDEEGNKLKEVNYSTNSRLE